MNPSNDWSPSYKYKIPYYYACPRCMVVQPIPASASYYLPKRQIPLEYEGKCLDCHEKVKIVAESRYEGLVADHRIQMEVQDLEFREAKAEGEGDYIQHAVLKIMHNYLDLRVLDWERGGPAPHDPSDDSRVTLEEFLSSHYPLLKTFSTFFEAEPFFADIIEARVHSRLLEVMEASIELPKADSTAEAYRNLVMQIKAAPISTMKKEEITAEYILKVPMPTVSSIFPEDTVRLMIAKMSWHHIFNKEMKRLLIEENENFHKSKNNRSKTDYLSTVLEAQKGEEKSFFKLISWDRIWLSCPWVTTIIARLAYDHDFISKLSESCSGNPRVSKKRL